MRGTCGLVNFYLDQAYATSPLKSQSNRLLTAPAQRIG